MNLIPNQRLRESGERIVEVRGMEIRTKFLWLRKAPKLGDRLNDWRVCWLGGWDRGRIWFVVMAERKYALATTIVHPPRRTSNC